MSKFKKNIIRIFSHSKTFVIVSILLILVAAIPRGIELLNGNYLFGYDQGEHFLAVKEIVKEGELTLIGTKVGGVGGFFQGPGWYYLLSIPFILTKGDPYGAMVMMFLLGIGAVWLSYISGRMIFNEKTGILIALLMAISPGIIPQSRFIWPPFPVTFLTAVYLFFLYKVMEGKKQYLALVTFTIGMMSHFEIATAGALIFQLALFSPLLFWKRLISPKSLFLALGSFVLTLLPLIIFDIRNQQIITNGILSMLNNKNAVVLPFQWVINNHFNELKENFFTTFYGAKQYWFLYLLFFTAGLIFYIKDKKNTIAQKLFVTYLYFSPFLLFLVLLKYKQYIWSWWILEMPVFYIYLFGILLISFWKKNKLKKYIVVTVLSLFLLGYIWQTYALYKNDLYDYGGVHKIKGKQDAIDYIYSDAKGTQFGLFIFTPPIYPYAYDYLIWWYGQNKYGYIPHSEKRGVFYLWIEPDPSKPWTYNGWLETVIKEGTVIKTITLPSGFIIQKRIK